MRGSILLVAGALCACSRESDRQQPPAEPLASAAEAPQSTVAGNAAEMKPAMLEVPADKQQLQRLVAMGYSVHEDHLHPPGTKECPFDMGGGVVQ